MTLMMGRRSEPRIPRMKGGTRAVTICVTRVRRQSIAESVGVERGMTSDAAMNATRQCATIVRSCLVNNGAYARYVGADAKEGWNSSCGGWIRSTGDTGRPKKVVGTGAAPDHDTLDE